MKNIEKYSNTKDALEAYNSLANESIPFDEWLKSEYEEPSDQTLLEAAQEVVFEVAQAVVLSASPAVVYDTWYSDLPKGTSMKIIVAIRHLAAAIAREKCKSIRNCDRFDTFEKARTAWFEECCERFELPEIVRRYYVKKDGKPNFEEWLFEKSKEGVK